MGKSTEILNTFYEIEPLNKDQFLTVRETLTRMGLPAKRTSENQKPILWQSCHIFHRQGRYYICHFKQLFQLDGRTKVTDFTDEDQDRTEFVLALLEEWGLVRSLYDFDKPENTNLVVIPYVKKSEWDLRAKYKIGDKNRYD